MTTTEELIDRALAGDAAAGPALAERGAADPALRTELVLQEEADRVLRCAHRRDDSEVFARRVIAGLGLDGTAFTQRVLASGRFHQYAETRRRRPRPVTPRWAGWAVAAGVLLAAGAAWWGLSGGEPAPGSPYILAAAHDHTVERNGADAGHGPLQSGDRIRTGRDGAGTLHLGREAVLTLGPAVDLSLPEGGRPARIREGAVGVEVARRAPGNPWLLDAGGARITVTGTRFRVHTTPLVTRVDLERGQIEVAMQGTGRVAIAPGSITGTGTAFVADAAAVRAMVDELESSRMGPGRPGPLRHRFSIGGSGSARAPGTGVPAIIGPGQQIAVPLPQGMSSMAIRARIARGDGVLNLWVDQCESFDPVAAPAGEPATSAHHGTVQLRLLHRRHALLMDWYEATGYLNGVVIDRRIIFGAPRNILLTSKSGRFELTELTVSDCEPGP
ncbi:MAG: FecR protein [Planctomycetota bacterium]